MLYQPINAIYIKSLRSKMILKLYAFPPPIPPANFTKQQKDVHKVWAIMQILLRQDQFSLISGNFSLIKLLYHFTLLQTVYPL